ncbi:hypothetical protein PROSTU_02107 [Providencia stuartii ATCC 25827]|uniref:Uncharacterized protein n=1 Tax=Providencia stuartii ATCC 25827 TaxID=471874 RepID=A0AA86YIF3_PROST|nr:hypothetical protein PROSTU_02107 [Providencia stuartii ATCC 25827]
MPSCCNKLLQIKVLARLCLKTVTQKEFVLQANTLLLLLRGTIK